MLSTVVLMIAASTAPSARSLPRRSAARCKRVTRIVHGKKKRVCKKPALAQAGSVAATIPVGGSILAIVASDDVVWVLSDDHRLLRVDPATNRIVATVSLPDSEWPEAYVAVGDGGVWVTVASPDTIGQPELDSVLRIDPQTNQIVSRIHVGHSPEGIGVSGDAVWTANHRSEGAAWDPQHNAGAGTYTVSRVSVASNSEVARPVVETRPKGSDPHAYWCCGPQGMTFAAGSVWTTDPQDSGRGLVMRIDPATNVATAEISFAQSKAMACGNMAGDNSSVWLVSACDNSYVARIDPQTNRIAATVDAGAPTTDLALGLGSLWVTTSGPYQAVGLNRINPATNKLVGRTKISFAQAVATGAGSVWVGSGVNLLRITPR